LRPYSLYAKLGFRYDSNVRLEPDDEDRFADEDDFVTVGYFSGKYNVVNRHNYLLGMGYRHYQTWYKDLDEYDLMSSTFSIYWKYDNGPFGFSLSYLPHFYFLDSDSYIRKRQLKTEVTYNVAENVAARFSYSYYSNNHLQDHERDGNTNDISVKLYYTLGNRMGYLFGGMDFEDRTAFHSDHPYGEVAISGGVSFKAPWDMTLKLTGKYSDRDYDNVDLFRKYAVPGADIEFLVLVSNQYGPNKISVYGFGSFSALQDPSDKQQQFAQKQETEIELNQQISKPQTLTKIDSRVKNNQLEQQEKIAELYYNSITSYRAGRLEEAREGLITVSNSSLIPLEMVRSIQNDLNEIDNILNNSKRKSEIAELYYSSMAFYNTGQLKKAREGLVKVLNSGLIPPAMAKTVEQYIANIDNTLNKR